MKADEWSNTTLKDEIEKIGPPLVVSGTIPQLGNVARELMLDLCPELKVIFPSKYPTLNLSLFVYLFILTKICSLYYNLPNVGLHNPFCFGAHPKGDKCSESICALKKERKGGC